MVLEELKRKHAIREFRVCISKFDKTNQTKEAKFTFDSVTLPSNLVIRNCLVFSHVSFVAP